MKKKCLSLLQKKKKGLKRARNRNLCHDGAGKSLHFQTAHKWAGDGAFLKCLSLLKREVAVQSLDLFISFKRENYSDKF